MFLLVPINCWRKFTVSPKRMNEREQRTKKWCWPTNVCLATLNEWTAFFRLHIAQKQAKSVRCTANISNSKCVCIEMCWKKKKKSKNRATDAEWIHKCKYYLDVGPRIWDFLAQIRIAAPFWWAEINKMCHKNNKLVSDTNFGSKCKLHFGLVSLMQKLSEFNTSFEWIHN